MTRTHPYDLGLEKNETNFVALSPLSFIERTAAIYPDRIALIREHQVTHLCGAPIVYGMPINSPDAQRAGITHAIQGLIAGPAPPAAIIEGCERIGITVVAKPDPKWGEVAAAFAELIDGSAATEIEVSEHCRAQMARFKVPKQVIFGPLTKTRHRQASEVRAARPVAFGFGHRLRHPP